MRRDLFIYPPCWGWHFCGFQFMAVVISPAVNVSTVRLWNTKDLFLSEYTWDG